MDMVTSWAMENAKPGFIYIVMIYEDEGGVPRGPHLWPQFTSKVKGRKKCSTRDGRDRRVYVDLCPWYEIDECPIPMRRRR
jgi:hypothetical protein